MTIPGRVPEAEGPPLPAEIGFLAAQGVPAILLFRAAEIARACRSDAATALLNAGLMGEEAFYRALARELGTPFLDEPRLAVAARRDWSAEVSTALLAPGEPQPVVAAPRGRMIARLLDGAQRGEPIPTITSPTRLRRAVFAQRGAVIAADAADDLASRYPSWSCRPGLSAAQLAIAAILLALGLVLTSLATPAGFVLLGLAQLATLALLTVRLAAVGVRAPTTFPPDIPLASDDALPVYTVLAPLHREAAVAPRLIYTLGKLDYPPAKLDLKILIEEGDDATAAALARAPLPARYEILTVPPGEPRTKPRALNAALPLARGDLLVVYDAEDVVEPDQLRKAASLFARLPETTGCLQGRLVIDNIGESWLTRFFALEYAALFDVLVPALAHWRMPIPLGGTTTHFRTRIVRELGGWDAYNVTEDADLGIRMAVAGYHVGDLPSATMESAPDALRPWLKQRTRWLKGFIQTSVTHGRRPLQTIARLGPAESLCAFALVPGCVLSALLYPFLTLRAGYALFTDVPPVGPGLPALLLDSLASAGALTVLAAGLLAMCLPPLVGCRRRGWRDLYLYVPLMPLYFGLVSLAAWLAVIELARHPHRWNKTDHGPSRFSRTGALHLRGRWFRVRSASPARRRSPAAGATG